MGSGFESFRQELILLPVLHPTLAPKEADQELRTHLKAMSQSHKVLVALQLPLQTHLGPVRQDAMSIRSLHADFSSRKNLHMKKLPRLEVQILQQRRLLLVSAGGATVGAGAEI